MDQCVLYYQMIISGCQVPLLPFSAGTRPSTLFLARRPSWAIYASQEVNFSLSLCSFSSAFRQSHSQWLLQLLQSSLYRAKRSTGLYLPSSWGIFDRQGLSALVIGYLHQPSRSISCSCTHRRPLTYCTTTLCAECSTGHTARSMLPAYPYSLGITGVFNVNDSVRGNVSTQCRQS